MATSATKPVKDDPTTSQLEDIRKSTDREAFVKTHSATIALMKSMKSAGVPDYKRYWGLKQTLLLPDSKKAYPNVKLTPQNIVDIETLSKNAGKVFEGKVLVCRTILPSCLLRGVVTVADDLLQKRAVTLDLHNFFTGDSNEIDCSQLLPSGSFLAIKNPCLKMKATPTGVCAVQCFNSPSQVEMLSYKKVKSMFPDIKWHWGEDFLPTDVIPNPSFWSSLEGTERQTGEALKKMGNTAFVGKRFVEAIRWYTLALDYDCDLNFAMDLLSNRAAAFLSLRCYFRALDDSNKVLEKNAAHVKAVYRKTKSLIGLCKFEEAANFISKTMATSKELMCNKSLVQIAESARCFAAAVTSDVVDVDMMNLLSLSECVDSVESAIEFTGPLKEVMTEDGKGRGLAATENIRPGQLLLSSKAFALVKIESSQPEMNVEYESLIAQIAFKIHFEAEESGPEFYKLFAGPELKSLPKDSDESRLVDITRIGKIVQYNCFGTGRAGRAMKSDGEKGTSHTFTAVWVLPSLLNHSCSDSNATWSDHGDVLIVRAIKPIRKGEEILISFVLPSSPYSYRMVSFASHSFVCSCRLCELDKVDQENGKAEKRSALLKRLASLQENAKNKEITVTIAKLEQLRRNHPKLNACLITDQVHAVTSSYYQTDQLEKSRELLKRIHSIEREVGMIRCAVMTTMNILRCCLDLNDKGNIIKWVDVLKEDLTAAYGSIKVVKLIETGSMKVLSDLEAVGISL